MNTHHEDRQLAERLAALPREIPPLRDPWSQINERIQHATPAQYSSPAGQSVRGRLLGALAASLMVAFTAGWLLGQRDTVPGAEFEAPDAWRAVMTSSEAEYEAAFREFLPVGESRPDLPYQTVFEIEKGWAILKATEESIQAALAANPDDQFLMSRLMDLRSRQLDLLRQLAELDQGNRRTSI